MFIITGMYDKDHGFLMDGPWGTAWKQFDAPISPDNPLMFTCKLCGKTTESHWPHREDYHLPHCEHPAWGTVRDARIEKEKLLNAMLSLQV